MKNPLPEPSLENQPPVNPGTEERIRCRAYQLYENRGRADGHAVEDWLRAEAEILSHKVMRAAA